MTDLRESPHVLAQSGAFFNGYDMSYPLKLHISANVCPVINFYKVANKRFPPAVLYSFSNDNGT